MFRSIRSSSIGVIAAMVAGCRLFTGTDCSLDARAGITVDVRDSVSNAPITGESRIIARDGTFADTAEFTEIFPGPHALVRERPGSYTVTVEREGYQLWSRTGVRVTRGECHVRTVELTARLRR